MEIGIGGPPGAGKTTVFNALARAHARVGAFGGSQADPNRAVVKLPDPRVDDLAGMFRRKSIKHAEVQFVDVVGVAQGSGRDSEVAILSHLRTADGLLLVVGAFLPGARAEAAVSDLENLEAELILADLDVVSRRLDRLDREVRMARGTDVERQTKARELDLLRRLGAALDREQPIRAIPLEREERASLRGYGLLTAKPALAVLNVGDDAAAATQLLEEVRKLSRAELGAPGKLETRNSELQTPTEWLALPGRLEMELAELDPAEAEEFVAAMGIGELSAGALIQAAYRLLDRVTFLTVGPDEVRAWPIPRGATAPDAAAAIHTDLARGFIRAEVVTYEDLRAAGGLGEAKKLGKVRSEGKTYVVQDGDVINILFHV